MAFIYIGKNYGNIGEKGHHIFTLKMANKLDFAYRACSWLLDLLQKFI